MLSTLKCDIKMHHGETQEEISFSSSSRGCSMLPPTHRKLCRTLQSLRKLNVCLWKFDMHVCPAYSSFSSFFFSFFYVCQESSQECPHTPHTVHVSRYYFHIAPHTVVLPLTSHVGSFLTFHCCGNQIPALPSKFLSPSHSGQRANNDMLENESYQ